MNISQQNLCKNFEPEWNQKINNKFYQMIAIMS